MWDMMGEGLGALTMAVEPAPAPKLYVTPDLMVQSH